MIINGGTGNGYAMQVNEKFQAETFAEVRTEIASVSLNEGEAYIVASDFISLTTTASYSGILWIKNTDAKGRNMFIEHIRLCGSAADMEDVKCIIYRNPTTGTLISNAVAAYSANNNFGSANSFSGLAYKGADANTITNGNFLTQFVTHISGHSILDYNDSIVLPKNSSIGFAVKPTAAMEVCMEVNVHFK